MMITIRIATVEDAESIQKIYAPYVLNTTITFELEPPTVKEMADRGLIEGYPNGTFGGDRAMTRYEFSQIVYRALQTGAAVDGKLVSEFKPELERIRVDTVSQDKKGNPTIERVRVNK